MPEYYEVLRIKKYLIDGGILHQPIESFYVTEKGFRLFKNISREVLESFLINNEISSIETKAKYTLFNFKKGAMLLHYRFTGVPHIEGDLYGDRLQSIYSLPITNINKDYIRFSLTFNNDKVLNYIDTRCLSHIHVDYAATSFNDFKSTQDLPDDIEHFTYLTFKKWKESIFKLNKDLKTYLLDQRYAPSGIGNYLACEICHFAKLNPWKKLKSFTLKDYEALKIGINKVKQYCQKNNDYSWFKVYNQDTCNSCGYDVIKQRHKGKSSQSTTWCRSCQK
tara:strand:- start:1773 stop:2609 length:837 start_codon:yes stop_codon:yes gene_type:complete